MTRQRAFLELLLAAALWGFGFIAVRWGLESVGPLWLNALRLMLGFVFGFPLIFLLPSLRRDFSWKEFSLGMVPGLWLGILLILQTYGLQYTTVTKSGFITCLYIVFVPMVGRLFYNERTSKLHSLWVALSLFGAALICQLNTFDVNLGDWLTLGCAVAAALQIVEVGRLTNRARSAYIFTLGQSFWGGLPPLIGAVLVEPLPSLPFTAHAYWGLAVLIFGCTLLAFVIQSRTQRILSAPVVSLLFLLESPFAAAFAFFLFGETLTLAQAVGALLILGAAGGCIAGDRK